LSIGPASQTIVITSTPSTPTHGGSYNLIATSGASWQPCCLHQRNSYVCNFLSGSTVTFVNIERRCQVPTITAAVTPTSTPRWNYTNQLLTNLRPSLVIPGIAVLPTPHTNKWYAAPITPPTAQRLISKQLLVNPSAASGSGLANYAISYVAANLSIGPASQTIVITSTPSTPTHGGSYNLIATSGASWQPCCLSTSATPSVCTSDPTVAPVAAALCLSMPTKLAIAVTPAATQVQQTLSCRCWVPHDHRCYPPTSIAFGGTTPTNPLPPTLRAHLW
jgi:hypothetical protein